MGHLIRHRARRVGSAKPLCVSDAVEDLNNSVQAGETVLIGRSHCTVEARSIKCVVEGTDGGLFLSPDKYYTSFEE